MILMMLSQQVEQLNAAVEADIPALIARAESENLEFKASFRWDLRQNKVNRDLEAEVLKTLVGYMNREGGTLLIGVADDGSIVGLEHDYKTVQKRNRDGFRLALMTAIANKIGGDVSYTVRMVFGSLQNKDVCRVIVSPAHQPVYLRDGDIRKFYLRMDASTRELNVEEAVNYISMHWPKYRS